MAKQRIEAPPADDWAKETLEKPTGKPAELARWQTAVDLRRQKMEPRCAVDGPAAVELLKRMQTEVFQSPAGSVGVHFLPKSDGRLRMAYLTPDFDDEAALAEVAARAILEQFDDPAQTAVYWYTDDAFGDTGDGRVYAALPKLLAAGLEKRGLTIAFHGDGPIMSWEVTRGK